MGLEVQSKCTFITHVLNWIMPHSTSFNLAMYSDSL